MKKLKSFKIEKWTRQDYTRIISLYLLNFLILGVITIGFAYINCISVETISFAEFIRGFATVIRLLALIMFVVVLTGLYFFFDDRNFFKRVSNSEMIFLIIEISLIINFLLGKYVNIYLRPLALATILTMFLVERRSAMIVNIVFSMLIFIVDWFTVSGLSLIEYSSVVVGITSGFIAIFVCDKVYSRIKMLYRSALIGLCPFILFILSYFENGSNDFLWSAISAVCSGPLCVICCITLLPIFEVMFKKVTSFRLAELINHNHALIRQLIEKAPGTFNHSVIVANIAEACALAIGEDSLMTRVCAYYHDIGKVRRPEYFTENQNDEQNPHDGLTTELSVNIIRSHAVDGYKLVRKNGLPKSIADVCIQHHGTMPILFFYDKAKKLTDGEINIKDYSYFGPKPQTKISAIIMIADGCEAMARNMKDRSIENVTNMVRKIVNDRMLLGQFDECEITILELNIIIDAIVGNLTGIYHNRVEYPNISLDGINEERKEESKEESNN